MRVYREGPAAAWDEIRAEAEDLQTQLVQQLTGWVAAEVVKKAVVTILSMFVPGAGIVRAIVGIYDTVIFFIRRAAEIARMVGSFLGSIAEIAAGNIAAAAAALEQGLARALKLVIDFLARFLKLDGIPAKVRGVIEKVAGKVEGVVDRVVDFLLRLVGRRRERAVVGAGAPAAPGVPGEASDKPSVQRTPFDIGSEHHAVFTDWTTGRLRLRMSSDLVMDFDERVRRIRSEWSPLRREHPAGNFDAELDQLARDGTAELVAAQRRRSERGRSLAANIAVDKLALRLRDICARYDIRRIEGITNYKTPPAHGPSYTPRSDGRADRMTVVLSFRSRAAMRSTASAGVFVPGTAIARYQRGHLLAASLGGSNTNPANFAPMSERTNTTRGGIVMFEAALREQLRADVFPPWVVNYSIRCVYIGSSDELQRQLDRTLGRVQPNLGRRFFDRALVNEAFDANYIASEVPGASPPLQERIRQAVLLNFVPRHFAVTVDVEQAPAGGRLPASGPFDNHL
jgi:hypothetical protein